MRMISERSCLTPRFFGTILLWFVLASIVMCVLQYFRIDNFYAPYFEYEIAGFSYRPWILGCVSVLCIPFLMSIHLSLGLLVLPLLYLSHSSVCILAGLVSIALMTGKVSKKTVVIGVLFLIAYLFMDGIDPHRLQVWKNTLAYLKPFGVGLGGWLHTGFIHQNGNDWYPWFWAHNEFYQFIFELGIPGAVVLVGLIYSLIRMADTPLKKAILYPILLLSFFHPIFHFGNIVVLALLSLAFVYSPKGSICQ